MSIQISKGPEGSTAAGGAATMSPRGGAGPVQRRGLPRTTHGISAVQRLSLGGPGAVDPVAAQDVAAAGVAGAGAPLPHLDRLQAAFGEHDLSSVRVQVGGAAGDAATEIGAAAYATGDRIAFGSEPDLHIAAHEAAHVIQQRAGRIPADGLDGGDGDELETEADDIARGIGRGDFVDDLLARSRPGSAGAAAAPVQRVRLRTSGAGVQLSGYLPRWSTVAANVSGANPAVAPYVAHLQPHLARRHGTARFPANTANHQIEIDVHVTASSGGLFGGSSAGGLQPHVPVVRGATTVHPFALTIDINPALDELLGTSASPARIRELQRDNGELQRLCDAQISERLLHELVHLVLAVERDPTAFNGTPSALTNDFATMLARATSSRTWPSVTGAINAFTTTTAATMVASSPTAFTTPPAAAAPGVAAAMSDAAQQERLTNELFTNLTASAAFGRASAHDAIARRYAGEHMRSIFTELRRATGDLAAQRGPQGSGDAPGLAAAMFERQLTAFYDEIDP